MKYLAKVDPQFCSELCSEKAADDSTKIAFMILPADDIVLSKPLTALFVVPSDYPIKGGLRIYCSHPGLFRLSEGNSKGTSSTDVSSPLGTVDSSKNTFLHEANEVVLPWMSACKHDPAVHFYALRTLLKVPNEMPWDTPCEIQRNFPLDLNPSRAGGGGDSPRKYHTLLCGAGRTRGRRSYMEDVDFQFKEIKVSHVAGSVISLYGVLDGHGGQECAQHTSDELPTKLTAELRSKRPIAEALFTSYLKTDAEFVNTMSDSQAGCTATVCVWDGASNRGYMANAGDTRAVMCRAGAAVDLTMDKKATDPFEIARIYREGGFVSNGRVMGTLGVARAIGDCSLKHTSKRILVSDPEVTAFDYQQNADQFMVIASDGLWDVMSSQDAVNWIKAKLESHNIVKGTKRGEETISADLNSICGQLAKHADKELGSLDNVTVMILMFPETLNCADPLSEGVVSRPRSNCGPDIAAFYNMDHYENEVAASNQPWDAVIQARINPQFAYLFDQSATGARCGSSNTRASGADGYLSASLYGVNSDIYNDTMVDNLTLPKDRMYSTEHNSPLRTAGKDAGVARNTSYTTTGGGSQHDMNAMSPLSLMAELDGLLLDGSSVFKGSKVAPYALKSPTRKPQGYGFAAKSTKSGSGSSSGKEHDVMLSMPGGSGKSAGASDADVDMDFLMDDSNF